MKIQKCTIRCLIIVCVIWVSIGNAEERPQCYVTSIFTECANMTGKFLNVFSERDMRSLIIRNSNMTALNKYDFVAFTSVTHLTIISCSLEFPRQENLFASLSYLTNLRIVNSNINEDIRIAFSENADIKSLSLPGNKITIIPKSFLSGLFQIENVDLSSNRIERIEKGAFDELHYLKQINLENNRIGDKFDGKYVTLPSLECIICKKYDEKYHCSENDLTVCEKNRNLDQLWWMPPHVRIQLKHNPVCEKLGNSSLYTTLSPDNIKISTLTHTSECMIDQSEKCFKHERRDLFLFESCNFEKQSSDLKKLKIFSKTREGITHSDLPTISTFETTESTIISRDSRSSTKPRSLVWLSTFPALTSLRTSGFQMTTVAPYSSNSHIEVPQEFSYSLPSGHQNSDPPAYDRRPTMASTSPNVLESKTRDVSGQDTITTSTNGQDKLQPSPLNKTPASFSSNPLLSDAHNVLGPTAMNDFDSVETTKLEDQKEDHIGSKSPLPLPESQEPVAYILDGPIVRYLLYSSAAISVMVLLCVIAAIAYRECRIRSHVYETIAERGDNNNKIT